MAIIGEMKKLTIGGSTYTIPEYNLPIASASTLGGVKIGTGLTINSTTGVLSATGGNGTITGVTTNEGRHTTINVTSDTVEFNVPTKTSHLTNDSGFLTSSDLASVLKYKGTKASVANLPTTGNTTGDVWHITADGSEYAWDGSIWQELGTAIDLSGYAQLSGASFTGPVTFGDSVTADELNTGDLVVTGAASFTNNIQANTINGVEVGSSPKFTDTIYSSLTAASGGTTVSLVTTGEKYTWNNKQDKLTNPVTGTGTSGYLAKWNGTGSITNGPQLGSATTTYLNNAGSWATPPGTATGHTHSLSIATSTGTSSISLVANTKYQLSAGNNTYIFTTPSVPTKTSDLTNDGNGTSAFATMDDIGSFGGGTVTSITLKAGSGIALDDNTAITTTGTRTISHSDTSSQGSVSNSGRTYIQSITLDGFGHVTALSSATETVTNTDEKVKVAAVTSGTTYYPIVGTGATAATRQYDTTGLFYSASTGTTSAQGMSTLTLGNSTASGASGNKLGNLTLYGSGSRCVSLRANVTATSGNNFIIYLPAKDGTVALTSDIPTVPDSTGSSVTGITASTTATKTTLGTANSVTGVQSSTTTASKVTVGSHSTDYGVKTAGSGSFTQGAFTGGSFTQGTDSFTTNVPTKIDTSKFNAGSYSHSGFSGGSGSFSATVTSHVLSFSHTHTAASYGTDSFTAPSLGTGFYTVGTAASFTQGEDEFTPATHAADSHTHTPPTLGSKIPTVSASNVTVPIKDTNATSIPNVSVASATVSITDPGHTHTI